MRTNMHECIHTYTQFTYTGTDACIHTHTCACMQRCAHAYVMGKTCGWCCLRLGQLAVLKRYPSWLCVSLAEMYLEQEPLIQLWRMIPPLWWEHGTVTMSKLPLRVRRRVNGLRTNQSVNDCGSSRTHWKRTSEIQWFRNIIVNSALRHVLSGNNDLVGPERRNTESRTLLTWSCGITVLLVSDGVTVSAALCLDHLLSQWFRDADYSHSQQCVPCYDGYCKRVYEPICTVMLMTFVQNFLLFNEQKDEKPWKMLIKRFPKRFMPLVRSVRRHLPCYFSSHNDCGLGASGLEQTV